MPKWDKKLAVADLKDHIARFGLKAGVAILREGKYKDVERTTWWRWLETVGANKHAPSAEYIARIVDVTPADVLPVPPPPAVITSRPATMKKNLDFMAKLERLYADGDMLRDFSTRIDVATGAETVKIPAFFAQSIKLRSDLLERWIQAAQLLYDWEQMRGFYDAIIDEVAKVDPDTSARIMDRLDRLNQDRGFNLGGQKTA